MLITRCSSPETINHDELEKIDVITITDEAVHDDFSFQLVSDKEQYRTGENVKLYGEISYKGEQKEVIMHHSSSAIFFNVTEELRGYEIDYIVQDIGVSTTLHRLGKPYQEQYQKSVGYIPDDVSKDYKQFMEVFSEEDGFPPGYYTVKGATDFSYHASDNAGDQERGNLEATIDFKVVE